MPPNLRRFTKPAPALESASKAPYVPEKHKLICAKCTAPHTARAIRATRYDGQGCVWECDKCHRATMDGKKIDIYIPPRKVPKRV